MLMVSKGLSHERQVFVFCHKIKISLKRHSFFIPIKIFLFFFIGFEKPSAIQQRAIRPLLKGRDVIAQAQSGTGKTATFSISILQSIDTTVRETQVTLDCTGLQISG